MIGGKQLLMLELLAFFDCCIGAVNSVPFASKNEKQSLSLCYMATAHYMQNMGEVEKRLPIATLCPKYVEEHTNSMSRETSDSVLVMKAKVLI